VNREILELCSGECCELSEMPCHCCWPGVILCP